jgi:AcrR family transcriptional regulator
MATSSDEDRDGDKPTLMERITAMLLREPEDREELQDILRGAFERHLLDADALSMIEGVLSVSETTVRDIIRATELASGTFYNYFKSKEEVFQALQDETAVRVRPRLRAERIRARNFEEFITGTFRSYFDFVKNDQTTFIAVRRHREIPRVRIDTPEVIAGFDELRADIEIAIDNGVLPAADPDLLMASMVGVAFEVAHQMLVRDDISADDAAQLPALVGFAFALQGRSADGQQRLERVVADAVEADVDTRAYLYELTARTAMLAGNHDAALTALEKLTALPRSSFKWRVRLHPEFAPLRGNPRFQKIVR